MTSKQFSPEWCEAAAAEIERLREAIQDDMCPINDYLHVKTERDEARNAINATHEGHMTELKRLRGQMDTGFAIRDKEIERLKNHSALLAGIEEEFIGVWKFKTIDEGPNNRQWCASVVVAGRLVDTHSHQTIAGAIAEAREIVERLAHENTLLNATIKKLRERIETAARHLETHGGHSDPDAATAYRILKAVIHNEKLRG